MATVGPGEFMQIIDDWVAENFYSLADPRTRQALDAATDYDDALRRLAPQTHADRLAFISRNYPGGVDGFTMQVSRVTGRDIPRSTIIGPQAQGIAQNPTFANAAGFVNRDGLIDDVIARPRDGFPAESRPLPTQNVDAARRTNIGRAARQTSIDDASGIRFNSLRARPAAPPVTPAPSAPGIGAGPQPLAIGPGSGGAPMATRQASGAATRPRALPRSIQQALAQAESAPIRPGQVQQIGAIPGAQPVQVGYIGNTQPAIGMGSGGGGLVPTAATAPGPTAPPITIGQPIPTSGAPAGMPAAATQANQALSGAMQQFNAPSPATANPGAGSAVANAAGQAARTVGPTTAIPSPSMGMAAPAGRLASLARTPFGTTPYSTGGVWGGRLAPGTVGRASGMALGGQIAGGLWDRAVGERDGWWDDSVGSALRWGGTGAGIGSMILPGWGTAIGAGVGVTIGGVKGLLTGDDSAPTELNRYLYGSKSGRGEGGAVGQLTGLMDRYGISAESQQQMMLQLELIPQYAKTKEDAEGFVAQLVQTIPQLAMEDQQRQQATARSAAIQAAIAPMMQQQLDMYNQSATEASAMLTQASETTTNPALRDAYAAAAANYLTTARQAGLGYIQQIGSAPAMMGMEATQDYSNAYNVALARAQAAADAESGSAANATLFPAA